MRICLVALLLLIAGASCAQTIYLTGPEQPELTQGKTYSLDWSAPGAETVNVAITGTRTSLGTRSRGGFLLPIARGVSAALGERSFVLPWIDAISFRVIVNGYDASGKQASSGERSYRFRPAVLADRPKDGIYLDLHARVNQRLYVQKAGLITHVYICSSSVNYLWLPPNEHPGKPHDHEGVFSVLDKSPDHYSKLFQVHMRWALHYLGGHYIHATSANLYKDLGRPASHGCNRLTREDAHELYEMTPVGTRVEVIGPAK